MINDKKSDIMTKDSSSTTATTSGTKTAHSASSSSSSSLLPPPKDVTRNITTKKRNRIKRLLLDYAKREFSNQQQQAPVTASSRSSSSGNSRHGDDGTWQIMQPDQSSLPYSPTGKRKKIIAPISPTPFSILEASLPYLQLDSHSHVVDLGSGDGRWILTLAKAFHCKCIGVEIDEKRLSLAKEWAKQELGGRYTDLVEFYQVDALEYLRGNLIMMIQQSKACREEESQQEGGEEKIEPGKGKKQSGLLIVVYLFKQAMEQISCILKDFNMVSLSLIGISQGTAATNRVRVFNKNEEVVQILCVGFALPNFLPVWHSQQSGIRVYLYHLKQEEVP